MIGPRPCLLLSLFLSLPRSFVIAALVLGSSAGGSIHAPSLKASVPATAAGAAVWPTPAPAPGGGWHSVGNHRVRLDVVAPAGSLVEAAVPWRRRDALVAASDTFIVAGSSNASAPLPRCFRNESSLSSTAGTFTFASDGSASYFLYYLPFSTCEYANGACQYNADVTYDARTHCNDAPWWPLGTPMIAPTAATYEGRTEFDAYSDMEQPMSPVEFSAFIAAAAPPLPLGALLIAEHGESSARLWGAGFSYTSPQQPFCVWGEAAGAYFLKTGGDPSKRDGWDHGLRDHCCSTDAANCRWFGSLAACNAFPPSECRVCAPGNVDVGCPSWSSGSGSVPLPSKYLAVPREALATIALSLAPNANTSWQVLVVTPADAFVTVMGVAFSPAPPGVTLTCFSTEGVDFWGRPFSPTPAVNGLLPLWLGAAVDRAAPPGTYNVTASVTLTGADGTNVLDHTLMLTVTAAPALVDGNDPFPRIHWLNSRLGADDDSVPRPYTPLVVNSTALPAAFSMHGKVVVVGTNGLPAQVTTHGASASPALDAAGNTSVLAPQGVSCTVSRNGQALDFSSWSTSTFGGNSSARTWTAVSSDATGFVTLTVDGSIDTTGYISLDVAVQPTARCLPTDALSFELVVPAESRNAIYGMGLGVHGGYFEKMFASPTATQRTWLWDGVNGNNGAWVGSTTGGVLFKLKGDDPLWQASVPFDDKAAPAPPPEWFNRGAGGIHLNRNGSIVGFSGAYAVAGGNATSFKASLLITPVHNLNLTESFGLRYAQLGGPSNYSFLASRGATVVNMHQGNVVNPWINYPYLTNDVMRATSSAVHALGMRFSVYNTMRELSNRCMELFAMRAMGDAFVPGGTAPGADWLREHVATDFESAWSTPLPALGDGFVTDAAVRVVAMSRWNNFYVEGIQQMMRDFELDGIYLDEIAYDRVTMMRMRKLLDQREGVIDHHSDSGAFCVSPAMVYNEHYPFISKLWYGEGFPYDSASADYWLVEMSGLVFGLTADMLRYPGETPYHFKGALFAQSNRWQGGQTPDTVDTDPFVPVALWDLWARVGIADATLFGWWLADVLGPSALPVAAATDGDVVKVTTHLLPTQAVIAVASFATAAVPVQFTFNATLLAQLPRGLAAYCLYAPALPPFQPVASKHALNATFVVPPGQGFIFQLLLC